VDGRTGAADGDSGGDAGLAARHAPLHELEDTISRALERLRPAVQQAVEEARCTTAPLPCEPFSRAAGRARLLYTGGVSLLHFMESDFLRIRLCTRHAPAIRAARDAIAAASRDLARRVVDKRPASGAAPPLAAAEAAMEALLADVARDPKTRADAPSPAAGEQDSTGDAPPAAVSAADVESLGHVCFALADALRQLKLIVADLDPDGHAAMLAVEAEAAAVAAAVAAAGKGRGAGARTVGGRRVSTLM
jgi:hypothetical protein